MKEKTKKVVFKVYQYTVNIVYTDDITQSRNERLQELGSKYKHDAFTDGLHSCDDEDPFTSYIFFTPLSTYGVIAHECLHAIWRLFLTIGADFEEEVFAYHLTYLMDEAVKLKNKTKKNGKSN